MANGNYGWGNQWNQGMNYSIPPSQQGWIGNYDYSAGYHPETQSSPMFNPAPGQAAHLQEALKSMLGGYGYQPNMNMLGEYLGTGPGYQYDPSGMSAFQGQIQPYQFDPTDIQRQMGGPEGLRGILERVRSGAPQGFMEKLPWSEGQIGNFITDRISGAGASRRAGEYEDRAMGQLGRDARGIYDKLRGGSAATGMRGSSAEAALKAKGGREFATARAGVRQGAQEYEDQLKQEMFGQGMAGLGAYEAASRGDVAQGMQHGEQLLRSLQPELQAYGMDQQLATQLEALKQSGYGQNLAGIGQQQGAQQFMDQMRLQEAGFGQQGWGMNQNYAALMEKLAQSGMGVGQAGGQMDMNTLQNLLQYQMQQQNMVNQFNQQSYGTYMGTPPEPGPGSIFGGMIPPIISWLTGM